MDLLEHPLEAVAFRLYSLPIPDLAASVATGAAAAWTCLAAVLAAAAAAGLWRLRSSAVAVSTKPLELDPSPGAEVSLSRPLLRSPEPAMASTTTTAAAADPSSPKERYTAYYRDAGCVVGCCDVGSDEDDGEQDDDEVDVEEEHEDGGGVFVSDGADPFGWEVVVRSPTTTVSDIGTTRQYRRRSPTAAALGSVVQLWDQGGGLTTPTASPRRRRGRVVIDAAVSAL